MHPQGPASPPKSFWKNAYALTYYGLTTTAVLTCAIFLAPWYLVAAANNGEVAFAFWMYLFFISFVLGVITLFAGTYLLVSRLLTRAGHDKAKETAQLTLVLLPLGFIYGVPLLIIPPLARYMAVRPGRQAAKVICAILIVLLLYILLAWVIMGWFRP